MNKTVYEYINFSHFVCENADTLRRVAQTAIYNAGKGLGKIAWDQRAEFSAHKMSECNITGVAMATYRGRFKLSLPLHKYEIREGDGNQGEYLRGTIEATGASEALRMASRQGMIVRPWDVKIGDMEGDWEYASLASYINPIYGDSCRWCASATLISE